MPSKPKHHPDDPRTAVAALEEENAELRAQLEEVTKDRDTLQAVLAAQCDIAKVKVARDLAPGVLDDDPSDPRPAFNPELGWQTPAVIEWANRRRAKLNAA